MQPKLMTRFLILTIIIAALFAMLGIKLYSLTVKAQSDVAAASNARTTSTQPLTGARGRILDVNGTPLAFNEESYEIVFLRDNDKRTESYRAYFTEIMMKTIAILEEHGGTVIDTFAIRRDDAGEFAFQWTVTSEEAKAAREKAWRSNMFDIPPKYNAEQIYHLLRRRFYIPEDVEYDKAIKLLSIWQEVQLSGWQSHLPVTIAANVSAESVALIESRSLELSGMTTRQTTTRVYPKGETVSHIIGYTGRIVEGDDYKNKLEPLGYSYNDTIGRGGIESSQEAFLTGSTKEHQGRRVVELTSKNKVIRVLETVLPTDGDSVVLSLDIDLQTAAFNALKDGIQTIRNNQLAKISANEADYRRRLALRQGLELTEENLAAMDLSKITTAATGSAVVMDIHTGKVLASVTYPSFDNNLFTGGISADDYNRLKAEDSGYPLVNRAIASKSMPGSIFKMVTGLAALEEYLVDPATGVGLTEKIDDLGPYTAHTGGKTEGAPSCWTIYPHLHSDQDIVAALKNSCNYYFYTVSDRLTITKLVDWASKLGLDSKTGIELSGELEGQIGGQKVLYDNQKSFSEQKTGLANLVNRSLKTLLQKYCDLLGRNVDKEAVEMCAQKLIQLVDGESLDGRGPQIRQIMREELGIPEGVTRANYWTNQVTSLLSELLWNPNQTIRTGIGQAIISVTPIAVARYVAALANGGTVYNASIIDRILDEDGRVVEEIAPSVFGELDIKPEHLAAIQEGMKEVVSLEDGGTAAEVFKGFKYIDQISGKTGTAQVSASNNIDIENTSWLVVYAPREDPEIVVVSCVPNGFSGSSSAPIIMDIVQFYLDRKYNDATRNVDAANAMVK